MVRVVHESLETEDEIEKNLAELISFLEEKGCRVFVVPLFPVREIIYGKMHNRRVVAVNSYLKENRPGEFVQLGIDGRDYRVNYCADWFHLNRRLHSRIADSLSAVL